jgi:hypothetical protein
MTASSSKKILEVHVETCIYNIVCTRRKNRDKLLQTKSKKYLIWTHSTSGTNVDKIPQSCTQEKCQNYGSPRVLWRATKDLLRKRVLRMSRAPRSGSVQTVCEKDKWRSQKHIVNERTTEGGKWSRVSSTKTIEIVAETCNIQSWRRSNESKSTCQYMGWNTRSMSFFDENSKESKEVSSQELLSSSNVGERMLFTLIMIPSCI